MSNNLIAGGEPAPNQNILENKDDQQNSSLTQTSLSDFVMPEVNTAEVNMPDQQTVNEMIKTENKDTVTKSLDTVQDITATAASPISQTTDKEQSLQPNEVNEKTNSVASDDATSNPKNPELPINSIAEVTSVNGNQEVNTVPPSRCINESSKSKNEKEKNVCKGNEEENEEEAEAINIQELTEQIMNILNDGQSDDAKLTSHELLKKNVELQEFMVKLIQVIKEKTHLCANLEKQNLALIGQAQSLKDVIAITKDLLGIRNMEVEHLHADMSSMENRIKEERLRHNTAVARLNDAMTLNDKLKNEYLVQMDLFQKLREKYNEKVVVLTKENIRLKEIMKENGLDTNEMQAEPADNAEIVSVMPEEVSEESIDK